MPRIARTRTTKASAAGMGIRKKKPIVPSKRVLKEGAKSHCESSSATTSSRQAVDTEDGQKLDDPVPSPSPASELSSKSFMILVPELKGKKSDYTKYDSYGHEVSVLGPGSHKTRNSLAAIVKKGGLGNRSAEPEEKPATREITAAKKKPAIEKDPAAGDKSAVKKAPARKPTTTKSAADSSRERVAVENRKLRSKQSTLVPK